MSELCELDKTAPEAIYLQISDDDEHFHEPFPRDVEGITWCMDSVQSCEVKYVRADIHEAALARIAESQKQEPAAHIFPSDLKRFNETETFAQAYSVAVGNPYERSAPLYAAPIIPPTPEEILAQARAEERERMIADGYVKMVHIPENNLPEPDPII